MPVKTALDMKTTHEYLRDDDTQRRWLASPLNPRAAEVHGDGNSASDLGVDNAITLTVESSSSCLHHTMAIIHHCFGCLRWHFPVRWTRFPEGKYLLDERLSRSLLSTQTREAHGTA